MFSNLAIPSLSVTAGMLISRPVSEVPERINVMPEIFLCPSVVLCTVTSPVCSLLRIVVSTVSAYITVTSIGSATRYP